MVKSKESLRKRFDDLGWRLKILAAENVAHAKNIKYNLWMQNEAWVTMSLIV